MVTLEAVNRIHDHKRPPKLRVDVFAYFDTGEVVRFHPGATQKKTAQPHRMSYPSSLYYLSDAVLQGVGQSLHVKPPGAIDSCVGASQPADPVMLAQMHTMDFSGYDMQMCAWCHCSKFMAALDFNGSQEVDITAGEQYPWWLLVSAAGAIRDVIQRGVKRIRVTLHKGQRCILVTNNRGDYRVFEDPATKRIAVEEVV